MHITKEEVKSFYEKTFSMLKKKFYILAETKLTDFQHHCVMKIEN